MAGSPGASPHARRHSRPVRPRRPEETRQGGSGRVIPFRLDGAALVQIPQRSSSTAPQSPVWGLSGCGGDARACEVVNSGWYNALPDPPCRAFKGGQNVWAPTMALGCAGWSSPPAPSSEAGEPALSLSKRGDQSRARGRSNALHATVARMFGPPVKSKGVEEAGSSTPLCVVTTGSWPDADEWCGSAMYHPGA